MADNLNKKKKQAKQVSQQPQEQKYPESKKPSDKTTDTRAIPRSESEKNSK